MAKFNVNLESIKRRFETQSIQYIKMAGLRLDILEERHAKVSMPLGDTHVNHVGGAYAGSTFVLCEVAGGYAIFSTYGEDQFIPVVSKMTITYLKPTSKECYIDISFTEEEAEKMIAPILERGKGRMPFTYYVNDVDGNQIIQMDAEYYLLPKNK